MWSEASQNRMGLLKIQTCNPGFLQCQIWRLMTLAQGEKNPNNNTFRINIFKVNKSILECTSVHFNKLLKLFEISFIKFS